MQMHSEHTYDHDGVDLNFTPEVPCCLTLVARIIASDLTITANINYLPATHNSFLIPFTLRLFLCCSQ